MTIDMTTVALAMGIVSASFSLGFTLGRVFEAWHNGRD